MITLLVNIGIFVLICLFLIIVYLAPFTSGFIIVLIFLSTKGIANYYFAWFPKSTSFPEILAIVLFFICVLSDKVTFKARISSFID